MFPLRSQSKNQALRRCVGLGGAERRQTIYNTYWTCPVHFFRHAGANLGRAAGRDRRDLLIASDPWGAGVCGLGGPERRQALIPTLKPLIPNP